MTEPAPAQATPPAVPAAPTPTPPPAPAAPPATPAVTPAVAPAPAASTPDEIAKLQADVAKWQAESRKHEDRWKTRDAELQQQRDLLKAIAEKTGIEIDGKPDPDKLAAQLGAAQQAAQDRARELAIFRAAARANANAELLLDSRAFMAKTTGLDPSSADFTDQVKALVSETVTANPALAVTPAAPDPATPPPPQLPAASGADFSGAPGGSRQWTDADVERATPEELSKAIEQNLLANIGVGAPRTGRRR